MIIQSPKLYRHVVAQSFIYTIIYIDQLGIFFASHTLYIIVLLGYFRGTRVTEPLANKKSHLLFSYYLICSTTKIIEASWC